VHLLCVQCKEQSDHMMEIACLTVEMAAKNGGVFPEVLFSVAKHWFDLYMRVNSLCVYFMGILVNLCTFTFL